MIRDCYLKYFLSTKDVNVIKLPHNIEIFVGRSKITNITDQSCSRKQISLTADCEKCEVKIKQIGINTSGLDGFAMKKDVLYKVYHGTKLEILLNKFPYIIDFQPPPDNSTEFISKGDINGKRKLEDDEKRSSPKKKRISKMNGSELKETLESCWEEKDLGEIYIFTSERVKSSDKIAAFDMDGTLIKTKSGKVYPVDINDWKIMFSIVSSKLKQLYDDGFKIVIFSNQAPIGNGRVKIEDFKKKIEAIVKALDVPLQVFIATGKGVYRKPMTGMWDTLKEEKNDDLEIDMKCSFYCGDAAGRIANWAPGKKKDHSLVDKLFAENIGLQFYTPEQFFLGHTLPSSFFNKPKFDPKSVSPAQFDDRLIKTDIEIVVLVGFPGSGKSFLAKQIENKSKFKYVAVCQDVWGSWKKCISEASKLIQQGKSVIVDSTNPDIESRARWTELARSLSVATRCIVVITGLAHAQHNNRFRELMKLPHAPVPDVAFHTYKNKYVEPKMTEGFQEVITLQFNPCFEDPAAEKLYRMHLLEK